MSKHRIAVIPGDGIGKEVMPEGVRVVDAAARKFGIDLAFDHFDFSSWDYCERHGKMMPDDWKDQIGGHEAIFFGSVGWPASCTWCRHARPPSPGCCLTSPSRR